MDAETKAREIAHEIAEERRRQIEGEGWTPDHDDEHTGGEMACAAMAYASPDWLTEWFDKHDIKIWLWDGHPNFKDRRRDLIRAAALIVAEIERVDRAAIRARKEASDES